MILTPQEALVMLGRPYDNIMSGLEKGLSVNTLTPLKDSNGKIVAVTELNDYIPAFTLPISVRDVMGDKYMCIDLRKANREYKLDELNGTFEPTLLTEASFLTNLAIAQKAWMNGPADFNNITYDACKIYATWLATKVAKRLVLSPLDQTKLLIVFAYYWLTRVGDDNRNDMYFDFIVNKMSQIFAISFAEIKEVLLPLRDKALDDLDDLCKNIHLAVDTPKLRNFNRVVLQTLTLGSWMGGPNSKEIIAVATEYPPMMMTIIYRALSERSFKNTDIAQVVIKTLSKVKQEQYVVLYSDILRNTLRD